VDLSMEGPDDEPADVCRDDLDTGETIQALVNHARAVEGMEPAWFPGAGLPATPELEANPLELPEGLADPGKAWDRMTKGDN
jgi:hypothetical protein